MSARKKRHRKQEAGFREGPPPAVPPVSHSKRPRLIRLGLGVACLLIGAGLGFAAFTDRWPFAKATSTAAEPAEDKTPPKLNTRKAPGPAPEGMVWVPGGEFWMGINSDDFPMVHPNFFNDALDLHKVYVDGFWMDKTEVTNEQFARFVKATSYETIAERKPDAKEFPNVPASELVPFSIVFQPPPPGEPIDLNEHLSWWRPVRGASWKHPEGPGSTVVGREKHPVVHICWKDAVEYCKWAKKRLPTEAEWEFAARGGLDRKKYCWGNELMPDKKCQANYWQGAFPAENDLTDGFARTAPVASYPPNGYGLYDMAGNVWEWCFDFYQGDYYLESPAENPVGPRSGFDPRESGTPKRVQRGGSFLCADNYCMRYLPGARGKGEPTSAASHIGFRCVRGPE